MNARFSFAKHAVTLLLFICIISVTGCVERRLTICTEPAGALVELNDEEIGETPVTVTFNWYGDYRVRLSKDGYQTLETHCNLKRPWYDRFPFDFFAQILNPKHIVDCYEWNFDLETYVAADRDELIETAQNFKDCALIEIANPEGK